jgi:glycerophosphoryl diester phosphodiesterase
MATFKKVAHRGASGDYPENTRLAFEKAIDAGADMIELDCQMSQDGHVVIFHDEKLLRTARVRGTLRSKSLAELKQLDVGKWFKPAFKGQHILTLEEALESVAGKVDLCLEIKSYRESAPGIELKILFILSHYDYLDRTIISSFDYRCLARVRELAPEALLGVISGAGSRDDPVDAARRLGATSIHAQKELVTHDFLRRAWDDGLDVFVWTVNDVRDLESFASLGVQGLISNYPKRFRKVYSR